MASSFKPDYISYVLRILYFLKHWFPNCGAHLLGVCLFIQERREYILLFLGMRESKKFGNRCSKVSSGDVPSTRYHN